MSLNKFTIRLLTIFLLLTILLLSTGYSQTRSKIQGTVKDVQTGEVLFGANVVLLDTYLGAATDVHGKYFIINVPIGTYRVQATMIGYNKKVVTEVIVSADKVTTVDFELSSAIIQSEEVIVTAQRNTLNTEVSNTITVITAEQLENTTGMREISSFLEKQPGVSTENGFLQIRGGSSDQTGTFVNGMAYNNAAVGNAETSIPLSSIEQVSLLSGGFNAEYGNFRSGLINITTKSGSKDKYKGTISISRNAPLVKRFGPLMNDPYSPALRPYLDPSLAFYGTDNTWKNTDPYLYQQHDRFDGWIPAANTFNQTNPKFRASAMDYYYLASWMHMALPDYEGLSKLPDSVKTAIGYYELSDEQKKLFKDHAWDEEGTDYNFDVGFGGPFPFISKMLGNLTFYLSHISKETSYIVPVSRKSQKTHVTLLTMKTNPMEALTFTINGLWKRQMGVSPIKPAFGDFPDAAREGGFMTSDNLKYFARLSNLDGGVNYWYTPPMFPLLNQTTLMGGFTLNHVYDARTFSEFAASYLSIKDNAPVGDNRNSSIMTLFGPFPVTEMPYGKWQFAPNNRLTTIVGSDTISYLYPNYDALPGVFRRFRGKEGDLYTNVHTQQQRVKYDLVSQIGDHNYFKAGIEYNRFDIDHKLWMKWNRTGPYNSYEFNYRRTPSTTGAYVQDQISFEGIVANLGIRMDYFYGGGGKWPSGDAFAYAFTSAFGEAPRDPGAATDSFYAALASGRSLIWEKWEEYDKENPGFLQPVKNFMTFSPRLGVSFPVTERAKFYFNYGHFRSNPPYSTMYLIRYRYDKNGLYDMANPNLEPPKTVSYELGATYNFLDNYLVNLSGYYKDITGQNGDVNYKSSSGSVDYELWENNNYQDIQGVEINITKNDNSWITGWVNFNYMLKKSGLTGRAVVSDVTINDDQAGLYSGQESRFLPQPLFNANITFNAPRSLFEDNLLLNALLSGWSTTFFFEWKSGDYFTWNPLNKEHVSSNVQWPTYTMLNMKMSKTFIVRGIGITMFVDVSNLLNNKISLLNKGYAFRRNNVDGGNFTQWNDTKEYLASLRLPMYNSPEYDVLREQNPGKYIAGDDKIGDLRSDSKSYINDPDYSYFIFGQPRDIWFGIKIDF
ncbi:MAG TPA: TonB-dependent receptor [Ignavibacteriaceae bacterium]|nr:TonB-dependent receptor [Ignavibacteriaceae bacterium]